MPLSAEHDLGDFACGHETLDRWLKQRALKSEGQTARTYVVCEGNSVVGYYALATGSVLRDAALPPLRRNAPDPIPIVIIGRFAVARSHQGQGIGSGMLRDALRRCLGVSNLIGCAAVLVHAIDEEAARFYQHFGFREFPGGSRTLFLPIETLRQVL